MYCLGNHMKETSNKKMNKQKMREKKKIIEKINVLKDSL
jgi:hypothetical protein